MAHETGISKSQPLSEDSGKLKTLVKNIIKSRYLQVLALPGLIYYLIFHYWPMYGVIIAFKNYKIKLGILGSPWVGFDQFMKFFDHPHFFRLITNTILLNLYSLIFIFPIPIIFALFLNEIRNSHYKKIVQTVSYLPHFISLPAIIGILIMFLSPTDGALALFIKNIFNLKEIPYLMADANWFRPLYIITGIWTQLGWSAIIYIAALSGVNPELYEAATIDGATRARMMWHISIPSIQPTIIIMFLLTIGRMMSVGPEKVLLMQNAFNYDTSDIISTFVYRRGLEYAEYSFTTAISVFNSVINIILLTIANSISKKLSESSLW